MGLDVLVYYQANGRFKQQVARIERVEVGDAGAIVGLAITADPIGAEARAHPRMASPKGQFFSLDGKKCSAIDISEVGFAVSSSRIFSPGQLVSVSFEHQSERYSGRARIRSFNELPDPKRFGGRCFRYGLLRELSEEAANLSDGLRALKASLSARD